MTTAAVKLWIHPSRCRFWSGSTGKFHPESPCESTIRYVSESHSINLVIRISLCLCIEECRQTVNPLKPNSSNYYSYPYIRHNLSVFTARAYARAVLGVVILSVRLSVCLSHAWVVTKLNDALRIVWYHTKRHSLCYFNTNSGWWATLLPSEICAQSDPLPSKNANFDRISAHNVSTVWHSEKRSITTNIKSTTGFPTSDRGSAYVTLKCPKGWLKERFFFVFTARAYARAVLGVVILSVCPSSAHLSVCLSVTRVHCDKTIWRTADIFIPHEGQSLCYSDTKSGRRRPLPSEICVQSDPPPSKNADFDRFPLITSQP